MPHHKILILVKMVVTNDCHPPRVSHQTILVSKNRRPICGLLLMVVFIMEFLLTVANVVLVILSLVLVSFSFNLQI
jgi:hypothetical protein